MIEMEFVTKEVFSYLAYSTILLGTITLLWTERRLIKWTIKRFIKKTRHKDGLFDSNYMKKGSFF
jgi:ABC-type uncharacterized transport system permease subunit